MNEAMYLAPIVRFGYRLMLHTRYIGVNRSCAAFCSSGHDQARAIQRVYVINLDRHDYRWRRIKRELGNVYDIFGERMTAIARRFSAVDARYYKGPPDSAELRTNYSLADQLYVDPAPLSSPENELRKQCVEMTPQEVAVALSHIGIWRRIAKGEYPYSLVLEDDVIFRRSFSRGFDRAWTELMNIRDPSDDFEILYLSYKEARMGAKKYQVSQELFRPKCGLWQLSGYVLSKKGAEKLLSLLPVQGPVDLWMNLQFQKLDVLATGKPLIEQRLDYPSSNSYSILPILSKVGLLTCEKPLMYRKRALSSPVIASGGYGTGLTSLAMALSMLGYRCCSDLIELPLKEFENLFGKKRGRVFDAYVNIGSLSPSRLIELARLNRNAHFVITVCDDREESFSTQTATNSEYDSDEFGHLIDELRCISNLLVLPVDAEDKWELLCKFLGCDYPSAPYPNDEDRGQRELASICYPKITKGKSPYRKLKSDLSPWIVSQKNWCGIHLKEIKDDSMAGRATVRISEPFHRVGSEVWSLRDDTFPSNLALFRPNNFSITRGNIARLTLQQEYTSVREYTSGAICSQQLYQYGWFQAVVRPAKVSGLITGVFLHRDSPRQEIDIEILGKHTTKVLVNVFYNPGSEGTKLEYGYRGTPVIIDLGFDAATDFHCYAIEWSQTAIHWHIDGKLVYERANWDPTPIPHLPMQFNVNLWYSRSIELAGRLERSALPAHTEVSSIDINAQTNSGSV